MQASSSSSGDSTSSGSGDSSSRPQRKRTRRRGRTKSAQEQGIRLRGPSNYPALQLFQTHIPSQMNQQPLNLLQFARPSAVSGDLRIPQGAPASNIYSQPPLWHQFPYSNVGFSQPFTLPQQPLPAPVNPTPQLGTSAEDQVPTCSSLSSSDSREEKESARRLTDAVGQVAVLVDPGPTLDFGPADLDWSAVATRIPGCSPGFLQKRWNELYPHHRFAKLPLGVVLYCKAFSPQTQSVDHIPQSVTVVNNRIVAQSLPGLQLLGRRQRARSKRTRKKPWSTEEEGLLLSLQQEMGNKWTTIAERMDTGRSGTDVKNFWYNRKNRTTQLQNFEDNQ